MSGNHLHIWPRDDFMMIALPNEDHSFTANLFAPFKTLDKLKTSESLIKFYKEQFPDLLALIGQEKLVKDYFERQPKTLISIKVFIYIYIYTSTMRTYIRIVLGDYSYPRVCHYKLIVMIN